MFRRVGALVSLALYRLRRRSEPKRETDPHIEQALADQKLTSYPGCVRGYKDCRMFCGSECPYPSTKPRAIFVMARADRLRRGLEEPEGGGSSFTLANIEAGYLPPLPDPRAAQTIDATH